MGMVDAVSPYAYVANNPINLVDPLGLLAQLSGTPMSAAYWGMTADASLAKSIGNTALNDGYLGIYEANEIWRNNTDPNFAVTVDASKLTVKQLTDFGGPNNTASGKVVGIDDWAVHGSVTLQQKDGNVRILPGPYDFQPHGSFFNTDLRTFARNVETFGGFLIGSQWGTSVGTDFTINYSGSPNVVKP